MQKYSDLRVYLESEIGLNLTELGFMSKADKQIRARFLYETDNLSIAQIAKQLHVSPNSIQSWKKSQNWVKNAQKETFERYLTEHFHKEAIAQNIAPDKVVKKIAEGLEATKSIYEEDPQTKKRVKKEIPDHDTRFKFISKYFQLLGLESTANKSGGLTIDNNGEGSSVNIQVNLPELKKID